MEKRGLSAVIGTLILILVSLVAVGIIWVVISNIVNDSSEDVNIGRFTLDLEVVKAVTTASGVDVTVKRNVGAGDLSGLKFVVSNGVTSEIIEEKNVVLNELESQTFSLTSGGIVKSVGVIPVIGTTSGGSTQGDVKDTLEFSDYETAKNINGLVSWWRFENNLLDEVGNNDGVMVDLLGNPASSNYPDADYGQAISVVPSISNSHVEIPDDDSLSFSSGDFSFVVWGVKPINQGHILLSKGDCVDPNYEYAFQTGNGTNGQGIWFRNQWNNDFSVLEFQYGSGTIMKTFSFDDSIDQFSIYTDGEFSGVISVPSSGYPVGSSLDYPLRFGAQADCPYSAVSWYGGFDEIMLFNRSLSADEVKALYNLDFTDK